MFEKLRNWLIRKLGGVPRDTYENAVEIANRHQHEVEGLKLKHRRMNIDPIFVRIKTDRLQGRSVPLDYVERELPRMISNQLFACNFLSFESRDGETTAMIELVDRRRSYGEHNS